MNKQVEHTIQKLSAKLGFPLATLPIFQSSTSTAYTSKDGVFISRDVLNDSYTLACFITHEIYHWVIDSSKIEHLYPHSIVGYATDYYINFLIKKLYGLDVRKAKIKGLYHSRYDGHSLMRIAADVAQRVPSKMKPCGSIGFPHPLVAECAVHLRKKHTDILTNMPKEPFEFSQKENYEFFLALSAFKTNSITFAYPLDQLTLVRALWLALYSEKPQPTVDKGDVISQERVIVYSIPYDSLREHTVGDSSYSLWCAVKLLMALNEDASWRKSAVTRTINSILRLEGLLRGPVSKRDMLKFAKQLSQAKARLQRWKGMTPLADLLKVRSTVTSKNRIGIKPACLHASFTQVDESWVPNLTSSELVKRVRKLTSLGIKEILGARELTDDFTRALNESIEDLAESVSQGTQGKGKCVDEDEAGEGNLQGQDLNLEGEGEGAGEECEGTSETFSDSNEGNSTSTVASTTGSSRKILSGATKYDSYELMYEATDVLAKIYTAFLEVESMLQRMKSRTKRTDDMGQETLYEYGNAAERAVAEELALLADPNLNLVFLSRIAQYQLLQLSPQKRARSSLILMLDASGSMSGNHYALAVGFTLAIAKWMHNERRGFGIVMFSEKIDNEYFDRSGRAH